MRGWLRTLRVNSNMSQAEVAKALGISRQQYNFVENGERCSDMGLSLMRKISNLFNVSLDQISEYELEVQK